MRKNIGFVVVDNQAHWQSNWRSFASKAVIAVLLVLSGSQTPRPGLANEVAVKPIAVTDVRSYGAVGDGKTDNTAALNKAFAAAKGSDQIYFPAGIYLTDSLDSVAASAITVSGDGANKSVLKLKNSATLKTRIIGFTGVDVTIRDIGLDANAANNQGGLVDTLYLGGDRATLQRVKISGSVYMSVQVVGSYIRILDSLFVGDSHATSQAGNGIWSLNIGNKNLTVSRNIFLDHRLSAVFANPDGMRITENYFKGNHSQTAPSGGGQIAYGGRGVVIANNIINAGGGGATTGIEANEGATIVGNLVQGQGQNGILLQDGAGYLLTGNTVRNNNTSQSPNGAGINIGATVAEVVITANRINDHQRRRTQEYGVRIADGAKRITITGNDLTGNRLGPLSDASTTLEKRIAGNLPTSLKSMISELPVYANNTAALAGGLVVGAVYRTGSDPETITVVY